MSDDVTLRPFKAVRYEVEIAPSHYDLIKSEKLHDFPFSVPTDPKPGTYGANPGNRGNQLKGIKVNDSIVFRVRDEDIARLGPKGANYDCELERVVTKREERPETNGTRVYLKFK